MPRVRAAFSGEHPRAAGSLIFALALAPDGSDGRAVAFAAIDAPETLGTVGLFEELLFGKILAGLEQELLLRGGSVGGEEEMLPRGRSGGLELVLFVRVGRRLLEERLVIAGERCAQREQ